jgi:hypothetical protein
MLRVANVIPQSLQGLTLTVGGIATVGPDGDTVAVRLRGPEKRLYEWMVMLEITELPGRIVTGFGFAVREKSAGVFENLQAVSGCSSQPEKL